VTVHTTCNARWERDRDEVRLSGAWTLLLNTARRRSLTRELEQLGAPDRLRWDLSQLEALDSAGARVLWGAWHRRLPDHLDCPAEHLHWFRWLADTRFPGPPVRHAAWHVLERTGARLLGFAHAACGMLLLIGQLLVDLAYCARHPRVTPWKETAATIHHVGATSMLLLGVVGFLIGAVMTIQIGMALSQFGAAMMIVGMLGLAVLRELGPVICGVILAGRSGSAMTAGIGAMHLTGEYAALRAFGVSPSLRRASSARRSRCRCWWCGPNLPR
jgi:phospholipid/cholesterol/gamma-HCH transport system permease protein